MRHSSLSPVTLAAGLTLALFGIVTSYAFTGVGLIVFTWALVGWIREVSHHE